MPGPTSSLSVDQDVPVSERRDLCLILGTCSLSSVTPPFCVSGRESKASEGGTPC